MGRRHILPEVDMTIGDSLGNLNYRYSTYSAGSRGKVLEVEINARRLYYNILAPTELCGRAHCTLHPLR